MTQKSNWPLIIGQAEIAQITDLINGVTADPMLHILDYNDLQTALVIKALEKFMEDKRCPTGFRLELDSE